MRNFSASRFAGFFRKPAWRACSGISLHGRSAFHVYGGGEPVSFYRKHAGRIPYIHIKDCDLTVKAKMDENHWSFAKAVTENIMVEPGRGSINFAELRSALDEKGYDGWAVVEQDLFPVQSFDVPLTIAKRSRENLRKAGF